jgi:hypothetical protein
MQPMMYPGMQPMMHPVMQSGTPNQDTAIDSKVIDTNKNMLMSIVKEDGKLICKRILVCPRGMKCVNKSCEDYHHPKVDLDIINESH